MGDSARVKRTTSSPVAVLISWCRVNTLAPVISWTIASMTGRAVSIRWVPHLLQQIPPLFGRERLDQMLFGRGQNALKADDEEITEQVGANVLRAPAHVILLKATDSLADGGFDFSLGFRGNLRSTFLFSLFFHRNLESAHLMRGCGGADDVGI